jgi:hypothetical protein
MASRFDSNPIQTLFSIGQNSIDKYTLVREGKLSLDCERYQNHQGESGFKLFLHGSPDSPFYLTTADLDRYLSQRQIQPSNGITQVLIDDAVNDPFFFLEACLLEILQGTGYGSIVLEFEKQKRQQTAFVCSVTVSYRRVIFPYVQ